MSRHTWLKTRLMLKDNRGILSVLFAWFMLGFLVYRFVHGLSLWDALRASLSPESAPLTVEMLRKVLHEELHAA